MIDSSAMKSDGVEASGGVTRDAFERGIRMTLAARIGLVALLVGAATGCAARSDSYYARDVQALLETKGSDVSNCWSGVRATDPAAAGRVTVNFRVEEDTGNITNAALNAEETSASEAVSQCVLNSLQGLALQPGDNRPANAKYTWELPAP